MSQHRTDTTADQRLSYDECMEMFEGSMPLEAVQLLLDPNPTSDIAQCRARLKEMAAKWNAASAEQKARRESPALEAAMNAYWCTFHTVSEQPWLCVQAALLAARGML